MAPAQATVLVLTFKQHKLISMPSFMLSVDRKNLFSTIVLVASNILAGDVILSSYKALLSALEHIMLTRAPGIPCPVQSATAKYILSPTFSIQ